MTDIENAVIAVAIAEALLKDYVPPVDPLTMTDEEYQEYMDSEEFEF